MGRLGLLTSITFFMLLFTSLGYTFAAQPIYSPDGKVLFVAAKNDAIMRINPETGKSMSALSFWQPINNFKFTPDDRYIIVSSNDEIYLLHPVDLHIYKTYKKIGIGKIYDADLTPDQKNLIAISENKQIIILNAKTGNVMQRVNTRYIPTVLKITSASKFAYITTNNDKYLIQMDLHTFNHKYIRKYY